LGASAGEDDLTLGEARLPAAALLEAADVAQSQASATPVMRELSALGTAPATALHTGGRHLTRSTVS
jgi:hypothetical protein